jgi:hypothetical protein
MKSQRRGADHAEAAETLCIRFVAAFNADEIHATNLGVLCASAPAFPLVI